MLAAGFPGSPSLHFAHLCVSAKHSYAKKQKNKTRKNFNRTSIQQMQSLFIAKPVLSGSSGNRN